MSTRISFIDLKSFIGNQHIEDTVKLDIVKIAYNLTSIDDFFVEEIVDVLPIAAISKWPSIDNLVQLCSLEDPKESIDFFRILSNIISHENNWYAESAINSGLIGLLEEKLKWTDVEYLGESFFILSNLVMSTEEVRAQVLKNHNFVDQALNIIEDTSNTIKLQSEVLNFLNTLSVKSEVQVIEYWVQKGLIQTLIDLIEPYRSNSILQVRTIC